MAKKFDFFFACRPIKGHPRYDARLWKFFRILNITEEEAIKEKEKIEAEYSDYSIHTAKFFLKTK